MAKVVALSPVEHDGKAFTEGDEFEVSDKAQVAALEAAGAVVVKGKKAAAPAAADEQAAQE